MFTLHHLNKSRSKRVIWLLEELELPYNLVEHQRDPITRLAPDSLKAIHPLGKSPIIVDNDITICESGAVMEYLLNQTPNTLSPERSTKAYYQYLEWLHFAEGSLSLPVITSLMMTMETRDGTKPLDGYIAKELHLDLTYINTTLNGQEYFAGEHFSAADIMMTIMLEMAESLQLLTPYNAINEYLAKIKQRPAFIKATSHG